MDNINLWKRSTWYINLWIRIHRLMSTMKTIVLPVYITKSRMQNKSWITLTHLINRWKFIIKWRKKYSLVKYLKVRNVWKKTIIIPLERPDWILIKKNGISNCIYKMIWYLRNAIDRIYPNILRQGISIVSILIFNLPLKLHQITNHRLNWVLQDKHELHLMGDLSFNIEVLLHLLKQYIL